jgi:hypothetical protein
MSLIALLVVIAVMGIFVGLIVQYAPMPQPFKSILIVAAALAVLILVLHAFGVGGDLGRPIRF